MGKGLKSEDVHYLVKELVNHYTHHTQNMAQQWNNVQVVKGPAPRVGPGVT